MMPAGAGFKLFESQVAHFQAFEFDDADEFIAVLPDLTLLKF